MFSGIVQALSKKVKFEEKDYGYKLSVSVPANFTKKLKKGDSVAVNGVCLTVVDFKKDLIEFDVVHESIKLTNISDKFSSIPFNLERSLKIGDEVGGHFVSGHVHNIAEIISFENKKERILKIAASVEFACVVAIPPGQPVFQHLSISNAALSRTSPTKMRSGLDLIATLSNPFISTYFEVSKLTLFGISH